MGNYILRRGKEGRFSPSALCATLRPTAVRKRSAVAAFIGVGRQRPYKDRGFSAARTRALPFVANRYMLYWHPAEGPGLKPIEFIGFIQGAEAPCSLRKARTGVFSRRVKSPQRKEDRSVVAAAPALRPSRDYPSEQSRSPGPRSSPQPASSPGPQCAGPCGGWRLTQVSEVARRFEHPSQSEIWGTRATVTCFKYDE